MQTDSSDSGIAYVLAQRNEIGEEYPLAYGSRKLLPKERKFSTIATSKKQNSQSKLIMTHRHILQCRRIVTGEYLWKLLLTAKRYISLPYSIVSIRELLCYLSVGVSLYVIYPILHTTLGLNLTIASLYPIVVVQKKIANLCDVLLISAKL